jgi:hypothetical protein
VRRPRKVGRALLVALACALVASCGSELPIRDNEKSLFVRAGDLTDYGLESADARYEKFTKTKLFDGSVQVEYEYEVPETAAGDHVFLYSCVTIEHKKADAIASQGVEQAGIAVGLLGTDVSLKEVEGFYAYGDSARFYEITNKEGAKVGNYFTTREGAKVYSLIIAGFYTEDREIWVEMIGDKLKRFSAYTP